jgi:aryl-alcohol dehydrogenase-like predicted oxidoreductase
MTFGEDLGWGSSVKDSEAILASFLDRGGNFVDTANAYTRGHSEKIIGDYFAKQPGKRDRVVIATKFYSNLFGGDPNGGGANRKSIVAACHDSLRRLQTDYIDLYWMHAWDRHTPIEETMRALDDLVTAGKVRYIGFSDAPAWKVAQAQTLAQIRGLTPLIALQIEYSLLERTVEGELIPMAQELGLGVTPWSPLRSGLLTGKYTRNNAAENTSGRAAMATRGLSEAAFKVIDEVIAAAKTVDSTPARVALAWVQGKPGVASTIIGARTMEQLDQNLAALDVALPAAVVEKLDAVSAPVLGFPAAFLSRAGMFMHGGMTVNGDTAGPSPFTATKDAPRY